MDIKPPQVPRRISQTQPVVSTEANIPTVESPLPRPAISAAPLPSELPHTPQRSSRKKRWGIFLGCILAIVISAVAATAWYLSALQPRDSEASLQVVTVEQGMNPRSIARLLEEEQIIRSGFAFEVYTVVSGSASSLQAGTYRLGPAQSIPEIVDHIRQGINDTYNVTILPGMTLRQLADPAVNNSLAAQGFSTQEISDALSASYTARVLADRPQGASLEGYIFPETYQMRASDSLKSLVQRSLDELYKQLEANNLLAQFKDRDLTIHEAVTLASIVQKEVSNQADQPRVAQVFLSRLSIGMKLDSDVTFIYAANQAGVTPSVSFESPYNTRKYAGLPPGPIANMNLSALKAVAEPADADYLYFVAGDDGVTYFSRTYEEHQRLVAAHCIRLCSEY